jgi:hypothetical protein
MKYLTGLRSIQNETKQCSDIRIERTKKKNVQPEISRGNATTLHASSWGSSRLKSRVSPAYSAVVKYGVRERKIWREQGGSSMEDIVLGSMRLSELNLRLRGCKEEKTLTSLACAYACYHHDATTPESPRQEGGTCLCGPCGRDDEYTFTNGLKST